jgi:magnesium transporter
LRGLASHAEDTAGGLMTLEFVTLTAGTLAGDALAWLRRERPDEHAMSYVYVLDPGGRLAGVLSLRELVLADPAQEVDAIMEDDLVTVAVDTDEEEVGRLMIKYNLLAVPVVDDERRLLGIVTLDDALDVILPDDWKRRLPRLFR